MSHRTVDRRKYEEIQTGLDRLWFDQIAARLGRRGARILDVGCGNGVLIDAFRRRGCTAEGLDPSPWARAAAGRKGFVLHESYVEDEVLPPGGYDVVTSTSTFDHIPDPVKHIRSLLRLLRPGGVLYICGVPNYGSWVVRARLSSFHHNNPPRHANFFTPHTLLAAFNQPDNARYIDRVQIRTYGLPEAHHLYNVETSLRSKSKCRIDSSSGGNDAVQPTVIQRIAVTFYYLLGRPLQLGDKLEAVARRSAATWAG